MSYSAFAPHMVCQCPVWCNTMERHKRHFREPLPNRDWADRFMSRDIFSDVARGDAAATNHDMLYPSQEFAHPKIEPRQRTRRH